MIAPWRCVVADAEPTVLYDGGVRHRAYLGTYVVLGLLSCALIGLPFLLWRWLKTRSEHWTVSEYRIEHTHGVLTQRTDSLELWRVRDVTYLRTLADRLVGDGRIILHTNDLSDPVVELVGLRDHRTVFDHLRVAVESARHRHRVIAMEEHA